MKIYDKASLATEEDDRNLYNKYVCHKPDALFQYWLSVGAFAMQAASCCNFPGKHQIPSKGMRKL